MKKIFNILFVIFSLSACKTQKSDGTKALAKSKSAKQIIAKHNKLKFDKKTISAKLKVNYKDANNSQNLSASLRIAKDEKIWISLSAYGFPVAKVLITPTRVSYYEKINHTYFDGDFALLSNFLGTELDYQKVQNVLVGEAILSLKKGKYKAGIEANKYILTPKRQHALYDFFLALNPDNYKVAKQAISQNKQDLSFDYTNYQKISGTAFPKNLNITVDDNGNTTAIKILYKTVIFNKTLKTPFKIPSSYKEIKINQ
jgi:hypothetical protein